MAFVPSSTPTPAPGTDEHEGVGDAFSSKPSSSGDGNGGVGDVELGISLATVRVVGAEAAGAAGDVMGNGDPGKNTADPTTTTPEDEDEEEKEERAALLVSTLTSSGLGDGNGAAGDIISSSSSSSSSSSVMRRLECVLGVLSTVKGECVMLCATFIYALQNVIAKTVERRVPPLQVVFIRSLLSGAVTCATIYQRMRANNRGVAKANGARRVMARKDEQGGTPVAVWQSLSLERFLGDREIWHLCLIRGVSGSIAFSLAYISLTYLTVGDSVAIFFLNPIFSALLAWPVLGEAVGIVEAAAILLGLVGTVLVVKPPAVFGGETTGAAPLSPTGVVVTLFSAMFCSIAMISIRYVGKRASPLVLAVWFHGCSTVMGFASCVIAWPGVPVFPNATEWALLLLISITRRYGVRAPCENLRPTGGRPG